MENLKLTDIKVNERLREDLGDVEQLAISIRDQGLIQPIVVDADNNLIAGGRRFTAFSMLADGLVESEDPAAYHSIPCYRREELSESRRRMLEIEENVRRKNMTWQEYAIGVFRYHNQAKREAAKSGEQWLQQMTADILGVSQGRVSTVLEIGRVLASSPDHPYHKEACLMDALRRMVSEKADAANAELFRRAKESKSKALASAPSGAPLADKVQQAIASITAEKQAAVDPAHVTEQAKPSADKYSLGDASEFIMQGDCLEWLPKVGKIDHIITDPPYGISMDNLDCFDEDYIEQVRDEHDVEQNKKLLPEFLKVAFDCISESGFLCMWYDLDHHELISSEAKRIGWRVCRWPFHWVKTSRCRNSAAQYNFTKAVEHCMILRRSEKSTIIEKGKANFVIAPNQRENAHPFSKPFEVWQPLIEAVSMKGQTIVDPFAGTCSGLSAFIKMERNAMGIELKERHLSYGLKTVHKALNWSPIDNLTFTSPI